MANWLLLLETKKLRLDQRSDVKIVSRVSNANNPSENVYDLVIC